MEFACSVLATAKRLSVIEHFDASGDQPTSVLCLLCCAAFYFFCLNRHASWLSCWPIVAALQL